MPNREHEKLAEEIAKWTDDERALLFDVLDEGPVFARKMWRALERPAANAVLSLGGTERAERAHAELCEALEARFCPMCGGACTDADEHECPEEEYEDDFDEESRDDAEDETDIDDGVDEDGPPPSSR